ncbi:MAG: hypothetical protein HY235_09995 [Acidobacteria bacterium]|nr:hypothetical protein [Acidobacteriota bacterium]
MATTKKTRKDPAAVKLGRRGGKARLRTMTPEQRSEHARMAVMARWAKKAAKKGGRGNGRLPTDFTAIRRPGL